MAYAVSLVLLAAAAAITARTVRHAVHREHLNAPAAAAPYTDAAEHNRRLHDFIGTFATGSSAGDRVIEIRNDGTLRCSLIGPLHDAVASTDRYELRLLDRTPCLVTPESGTITMLDIDRLSYFDDVYRRTK